MKSIQFMTKAEYKLMSKGGLIDCKYPALFQYDKFSRKSMLSFLRGCLISLGIPLSEFNKLYMVEVSGTRLLNRKPVNSYNFILNKIGYALSPVDVRTEPLINNDIVYTV